jgi:hypothetical protein
VNNTVSRQKARASQTILTGLAAFVISIFVAGAAYAQASSWQVESIQGQATVAVQGRAAQPLTEGTTVPFGAEVATAADTRVVLRQNNDSVVVSPNSSMHIVRTDNPSLFTQIKQTLGTMLFRVEPNRSRRFEVETPYLAATVKGTVFTVSVRTEGASVHVTEGAVQVASASGQRPLLLRPGQTGFVSSAPGADVELRQQGGKREDTPNSGGTENADSGQGNSGDAKGGNGKGLALGRTIGNGQTDFSSLTKGLAGNANAQGRGPVNAQGKGLGRVGLSNGATASSGNNGNGNGNSAGNRTAGLGNVLKSASRGVTSSPGQSGAQNSRGAGAGSAGGGAGNSSSPVLTRLNNGSAGGASNAGGSSNASSNAGGSSNASSNAGGGSNANSNAGNKGQGKGKNK